MIAVTQVLPITKNKELRKLLGNALKNMNEVFMEIKDFIVFEDQDGHSTAILKKEKIKLSQMKDFEELVCSLNEHRDFYLKYKNLPNEVIQVNKADLFEELQKYTRYYINGVYYIIVDKAEIGNCIIFTPEGNHKKVHIHIDDIKSISKEICSDDVGYGTAQDIFTIHAKSKDITICAISI